MRVFDGLEELAGAVGEHLGYSDWWQVTQDQVDRFADVAGDRQWIHVDERRAAEGPFGGTIAHGYLMLSMLPTLGAQVFRIDGVSARINYGVNRVRFPSPAPVGTRLRVGVELLAVTPMDAGGRIELRYTLAGERADKPSCVADVLVQLVR